MDINIGNCAAVLLFALAIIIAQTRASLRNGQWHRWYSPRRGAVKRSLAPNGCWEYRS